MAPFAMDYAAVLMSVAKTAEINIDVGLTELDFMIDF